MKNTLTVLLIFLIQISFYGQQKTQNHQSIYTYKQGVALNHWVSYPFKGFSYGDTKWFSEEDSKWIATKGFDHIKVYVSGRQLVDTELNLRANRLAILDSMLLWNKKQNLGTIITLSMFPDFKIDSSITSVQQKQIKLKKQVKFWEDLSHYFSKYKENLRFNIHGFPQELTQDTDELNQYNKQVLEVIRKSNSERFVYLPTLGFNYLEHIKIPENKKNIGVQIRFNSAIDVFTEQYSYGLAGQKPEKFPRIKFPGRIPDLTSHVEKDHWSLSYTNIEFNELYIDNEFNKISSWMKTNMPDVEFYAEWGYAVGWNTRSKEGYFGLHYVTQSEEDVASISTFAKAYVKYSKEHDLNWSIYSYNYQSPLYYKLEGFSPQSKVGKNSVLMNNLELKK